MKRSRKNKTTQYLDRNSRPVEEIYVPYIGGDSIKNDFSEVENDSSNLLRLVGAIVVCINSTSLTLY